jgi:hypothetical protein
VTPASSNAHAPARFARAGQVTLAGRDPVHDAAAFSCTYREHQRRELAGAAKPAVCRQGSAAAGDAWAGEAVYGLGAVTAGAADTAVDGGLGAVSVRAAQATAVNDGLGVVTVRAAAEVAAAGEGRRRDRDRRGRDGRAAVHARPRAHRDGRWQLDRQLRGVVSEVVTGVCQRVGTATGETYCGGEGGEGQGAAETVA